MSEDLFKEVMSPEERQGSFNKWEYCFLVVSQPSLICFSIYRAADKTPLNALVNIKPEPSPFNHFDELDSIVSNLKTDLTCGSDSNHSKPCDDDEMIEMTSDDSLTPAANCDKIDTHKMLTVSKNIDNDLVAIQSSKIADDIAERPLSNFNIAIDSITPGDSPPRTIMKETAGLEITLHFAKDRPRDDISVIVITTTNHNAIAITDYQFDASVSKVCVDFRICRKKNQILIVQYCLPAMQITASTSIR